MNVEKYLSKISKYCWKSIWAMISWTVGLILGLALAIGTLLLRTLFVVATLSALNIYISFAFCFILMLMFLSFIPVNTDAIVVRRKIDEYLKRKGITLKDISPLFLFSGITRSLYILVVALLVGYFVELPYSGINLDNVILNLVVDSTN